MSSGTPDSTRSVDEIARSLPAGTVYRPGTDQYAASTSPDNSSFPQRPDAVVRPRATDDVAAAVTLARALGSASAYRRPDTAQAPRSAAGWCWSTPPRSTRCRSIRKARTARVGAGVTWSKVQEQAETHHLLALSGTSPTVGVSGYTFNGGVGWLARPFGLASSSLRAVEYVDGVGRVHRVSDDSADDIEREALWAFRGGAPVGLATELEFDLFPVSDLWAGYLLWPAEHLTALAAAWTGALEHAPDTLTSTLSLLADPAAGPVPRRPAEHDRGAPVLRLDRRRAGPGAAARGDARGRRARRSTPPARPTPRPCPASTSTRRSPCPRAALGRWLGPIIADVVVATFQAARIGQPDGLNMIELRHVDSAAQARNGRPHPAARPVPAARGRRRGRRRAASGGRLLPRPSRGGRPAGRPRTRGALVPRGAAGPGRRLPGTRAAPAGPGRRAHGPRSGLRLPARPRPAPEPRNRFAVTRV